MFGLTMPGWSPYKKMQFPWLNACLFAQSYCCFTALHFLQGSQWEVTLVLPKSVCQTFNKGLNKGPGTKTSVQSVHCHWNKMFNSLEISPASTKFSIACIHTFSNCGTVYSHFLSSWSPTIMCSKMRRIFFKKYTLV